MNDERYHRSATTARCALDNEKFVAVYRGGIIVDYRCRYGHTPADALTTADVAREPLFVQPTLANWSCQA